MSRNGNELSNVVAAVVERETKERNPHLISYFHFSFNMYSDSFTKKKKEKKNSDDVEL